jgi:hypothetical protein
MKVSFKRYPRYIGIYQIFDLLRLPESWADKFSRTKIGGYVSDKLNKRYETCSNNQAEIRIDKWDTWSADFVLAKIAHPLLIQLKEAKQGIPMVDDIDVPHIPMPECYDENKIWEYPEFERRWEWVMDEMIWALGEISNCKENEPEIKKLESGEMDLSDYYAYQDRIVRGTTLFGKYFQNLWT